MRQNQKYPIFTVTLKKHAASFGLAVLLIAIIAGSVGCKKRSTVEVPRTILEAKSAALDELLQIVNQTDEIRTLRASKIDVVYTSEKKEGSLIELERYPKAPGIIFLKRPDSTFLILRSPAIGKREISLLSKGDEFRVWIHGRREFYIGKNSAKELISDDPEKNQEIPIRASHIFEAIFPRTIPLNNPALPYEMFEEETADAKFYILTVFRNDSSFRIRRLREFKIERAGLTIAQQRIFNDEGRVVSDIVYSEPMQIDKYTLPGKISIERPLDGYTLELEFENWEVNPVLKDSIFRLEPVKEVEVIRFK